MATTVYGHVTRRKVNGDCQTCNYAALEHITIVRLGNTGVTIMRDETYCARCRAIEHSQ